MGALQQSFPRTVHFYVSLETTSHFFYEVKQRQFIIFRHLVFYQKNESSNSHKIKLYTTKDARWKCNVSNADKVLELELGNGLRVVISLWVPDNT